MWYCHIEFDMEGLCHIFCDSVFICLQPMMWLGQVIWSSVANMDYLLFSGLLSNNAFTYEYFEEWHIIYLHFNEC